MILYTLMVLWKKNHNFEMIKGILRYFPQTFVVLIQVSHQVGSLMDLYTTFIDLAEVSMPTDRIIDGISLRASLLNNTNVQR